ncbi:MAG: hypothetical protein H6R05_172 [Burkholderiaceae bacterium]|nr:hypothetical protein [Burkholderiaceae bacterium]
MSEIKMKIVWIDDDQQRFKVWEHGLGSILRGTNIEGDVETFQVKDDLLKNIELKINDWKDKVNLFIIDHTFTQAESLPFALRGSVLAHLLRNALPNIPIVCVSGQKMNSNKFNMEDISEYTYLFPIDELGDPKNQERLFSIAKDFNQLIFSDSTSIRNSLVELLAPPESVKRILYNILPEEFESEIIHGTTPHRIAHWVLNVLMEKPGFLLDRLAAATYVGLKEVAFESHKDIFSSALYKGPFHTDSHPYWWVSSLTDELYRALPNEYVNLVPQQAGRYLEGVSEEDYSVCFITQKHTPAPDSVAYSDATMSSRHAVQCQYTSPLNDEEGITPGFAARLKMNSYPLQEG